LKENAKTAFLFGVNSMKSEISKRIEESVKKAGGQTVVSKKVGIPLKSISNYCLGISPPKLEPLIKIAKVADVSLEWLITGEGTPEQRNNPVDAAHDKNLKTAEFLMRADFDPPDELEAAFCMEVMLALDKELERNSIFLNDDEKRRIFRSLCYVSSYCSKATGLDKIAAHFVNVIKAIKK